MLKRESTQPETLNIPTYAHVSCFKRNVSIFSLKNVSNATSIRTHDQQHRYDQSGISPFAATRLDMHIFMLSYSFDGTLLFVLVFYK